MPVKGPDMGACPLCGARLRASPHLEEAFDGDAYGLWLARSVCHYRHVHLRSYDRAWRSWAYARKVPAYRALGHEGYKAVVNERAKRQIIRGVLKGPLPREVKALLIAACARLEHQDLETLALMEASLRRLWAPAAGGPLKMRDDRHEQAQEAA